MLVSWTKQINQNVTGILIRPCSTSGPIGSWDIKDRLFCSQILKDFYQCCDACLLFFFFFLRKAKNNHKNILPKFTFWPTFTQLIKSPFLIPTFSNYLPLWASTPSPHHFLNHHIINRSCSIIGRKNNPHPPFGTDGLIIISYTFWIL